MTDTSTASHPVVFAPGLRLARIAWRVLPAVGWVAVALLAAWLFGASAGFVEQLLVVAAGVLTFRISAAVVRELLSPDRAWLRIFPISDLRAQRLDAALRWVLFFVIFSAVGIYLVQVNGWNPVWGDLLRVLINEVVIVAAFVILATSSLVRWLRRLEGDGLPAVLARFTTKTALPIAFLSLAVAAIASGLAYVPLARWVVVNGGVTILKLLVAVLLYRWLRRFLYRTVRFYTTDESADQEVDEDETNPIGLGVVRITTGIVKLGLIVLTTIWILRTWSLSPVELMRYLDHAVPGNSSLTWSHVMGGVLRVVAAFWVGWLVRTILIYFVFSRSRIGLGARYAVLAVLRYVVVAFAIVFALDALGVDTTSLSWFFGAAGIGLAFGLQDVIGNFVSGLIMLVERPIRVGDMVQIGQEAGTVEDIRMRGTTLRTFDNTTLLIPNSQMLGERVTNLSHAMAHRRIKVPLIVPHDADVRQVEQILLDAARENADVLEDPAPFVWFDHFSPSSLDFTLVCFTQLIRGRFGVASRLRFAIMDALREAGIEIPVTQQDVHVHGIDDRGLSTPADPGR